MYYLIIDLIYVIFVLKDLQFGKESLSSFIEKKREMFLLQYSLGVKRDEIKKLEDIIQVHYHYI